MTIKRRSVLYVANFIVPILFFLCLDLASFLISESGGEKLSFKVTVLLAVTVMQLILNDILPSSSDRIPLIGKEAQSPALTDGALAAPNNSMSAHSFLSYFYHSFFFQPSTVSGFSL